jgi:hypothetical protein
MSILASSCLMYTMAFVDCLRLAASPCTNGVTRCPITDCFSLYSAVLDSSFPIRRLLIPEGLGDGLVNHGPAEKAFCEYLDSPNPAAFSASVTTLDLSWLEWTSVAKVLRRCPMLTSLTLISPGPRSLPPDFEHSWIAPHLIRAVSKLKEADIFLTSVSVAELVLW